MEAMVLHAPGEALRLEQRLDPEPGPGEVRLRVEACAVCRTDLHVVDGELPLPQLPLVPGHEIVGIIDRAGRKNLIHRNAAARHKSRLAKAIAKAAAK